MTDTEGLHNPVLIEVLRHAQDLGFIGTGPLGAHLDHGLAFARTLDRVTPRGTLRDPATRWLRVADLGSGGGLPALVIATSRPDVEISLIESHQRRANFLGEAVGRLDLAERVTVVQERAELVGRDVAHRGTYDAVTARAFGPPGVVAECAAPLLMAGGLLVVSGPPEESLPGNRWPPQSLAQLGLGPAEIEHNERHFALLSQVTPCPDRFPRRVGVPAKRPLF